MKSWVKAPLLLTLCIVLALGACSSKDDKKNGKNLTTVTVMLDWYPNAVHTALYDAIEKGYFEKEGLDVEVKMPAETNDPIKLVAANKIDIAISYQTQVIVSRAQDIPVVSIGAVVRHPLDYLMVKSSSGIKRPKDLEGKVLGSSSAPVGEALIDTVIKHDGGDPTKVKKRDVGFNLIPSLATDRVDAIDGAYINHEKILLEKEGHKITAFNPAEYGVPDYYELVAIASEEGISKNKEMYKKFWRALSKGQENTKKNPDKTLQQLLQHEDKSFKLDADVEKKSLQVLLPLMDSGKKPFGYQEEASWRDVAHWMYKQGAAKRDIDVKKAFVNIMD
ncbi:NMT1/THI5 like domain-containing protein [Fictibacillus macauensis ZFHKF-1]|uniref:NMT1/THI5 like domain-containing protein n=1 Tax=Fictibacillus macauensis ZFHKF-1 TaxID=1196324 RepID=I8AJM6_9BACL|nr:ABC transporter substrate-binding protein [Fictibacillus macauensis]EIT85739.1 NMT1/THI5 like domain-containing protein [Fictibacillus macauensis ZFHKF-1]